MPLAIASRYATALADVVGRAGSKVSPAAALEQLRSFQALFAQSPELQNALTSPAVRPAQKRRLVQALGERLGLATPVRNFLYIVMDHRRLRQLDEMMEVFGAWLDGKAGIARIEVVSAQPLDERLRETMRQRFGRVTGKQVLAGFAVDPALIGGATVRHGSQVFDGSIRSQLRALDRAISGDA
jgi:F-type H+-transporting ATPase subunit delta